MVNGKFYVVYEFEGKSPTWKSYPSEQDYRDAHADRKGITRVHEGLGEQRANELFLSLTAAFEDTKRNSGRKTPSKTDVSDMV